MLLSQQAHLRRLDNSRAVVRVSGNWIAMVQSRLPLLEGAVTKALGSPRQVTLEAGETAPAAAVAVEEFAPARPAIGQPTAKPPGQAETVPPPAAQAPVDAATQRPETSPHSREAVVAEPTMAVANAAPIPAGSGPIPVAPSKLDQNARQLADFFNGELLDDSLNS
jgi:DNA polymerase-3 subunit gamma/tau